MKFSIERELLQQTLIDVSRGLSDKKPLPVLTGIKIEALDSELFFTTTNKEISVQVKLPVSENVVIEETGYCVAPGKYFVEISKKIEGKKVNFTLFEEKTIKITSERSDFTLIAYDKEFFPTINFESKNASLDFESKKLRQLIRQTAFAAATSESRIILTSVNFTITNDLIIVTATDSFRLARKEETIPTNDIKCVVNIPSKSLEELAKILDDSNEKVNLYIIDKTVLFVFKNISFLTRLVEGVYPDTSSLFPKQQLLSVKLKKSDIVAAVDRASLFTNSDNLSVVKFNISNSNTIEISSNSTEIGKVVEEVEAVEISSNFPFQTAFSTKYLTEALRAIDDTMVVVNFTGEVKPAVIKGEGAPEMTQLLLPVRVF